MELTGKLKEEVEKAKSKEKVKEAFEKAGLSLSDEELDNVSGGRLWDSLKKSSDALCGGLDKII